MFGNLSDGFFKNFGKSVATNTVKTIINTSKNMDSEIIMQGIINANVLNIRSEPSKDGSVIGKLGMGNVIGVIEDQGEWLKFKYNGNFAYVVSKFVEFMTGYVDAGVLNVRSQASKESEVLGKLGRNDQVKIMQQLDEWYKILYNGKAAFVVSTFIKLNTVKTTTQENEEKPKPTARLNTLKDKTELLSVQLEPETLKEVPTNSASGKVVAETYNKFGGFLTRLSSEIKIDVGAAIAVLAVESGGKGFGDNGKTIIRFENHLFYRYWGKKNEKEYNRHFKFSPVSNWKDHAFRKDRTSDWVSFHGNQDLEWEVLEFARTLDNDAALFSASYGAPQVLGSNHLRLGYNTPEEMVNNFGKDIRYHILALFDFFNDTMIGHLQDKEFSSFARYYNGPGQETRYGAWIKKNYDAFKALK